MKSIFPSQLVEAYWELSEMGRVKSCAMLCSCHIAVMSDLHVNGCDLCPIFRIASDVRSVLAKSLGDVRACAPPPRG